MIKILINEEKDRFDIKDSLKNNFIFIMSTYISVVSILVVTIIILMCLYPNAISVGIFMISVIMLLLIPQMISYYKENTPIHRFRCIFSQKKIELFVQDRLYL